MAQVKTDDFYSLGYGAHASGLSISECPYPANSNENAVWRQGWSQSRFADIDENVHDAPNVMRKKPLNQGRR